MIKSDRKRFGVRSVTVSIERAFDPITGSLAKLALNKGLFSHAQFANHDTNTFVKNVFSGIDLTGAKQAEVDLEEGSLRMSADASFLTI